ncbi:MAG: 4Fe-4S binding protein [Chloroflexi bacterium]|nr:4Fe-4S binding protein [Chloroflexota bacterium]
MSGHEEAYRELAGRFGYADSPQLRRVLEYLINPLQARLFARLPAAPEELAQQFGLPVEQVKRELDDGFLKGLLFPRNFQTRESYRFARNMVQLHDATQSILKMDPAANRELFQVWEDFCRNGGYDRDYALTYLQHPQPRSRIVPAYLAIKDNPNLLPDEDIRMLLKAQRLIAVVSCSCRKRALAMGRECEKSVDGNCFLFGRGAEYALSRDSGRALSYEETLKIIEQNEEDGLIHSWPNSRVLQVGTLCSCCYDCCVDWERLTKNGVDIGRRWAKSRYQATVDLEKCDGCQICVERCQFDAVEMVKVPGSKKLKAEVDAEKCFGCGVCFLKCEPQAIAMDCVRPPEHIPAVQAAPAS